MASFATKIEELIRDGWDLNNSASYSDWQGRVYFFLKRLNLEAASEVSALTNTTDWTRARSAQIGLLEGLLTIREVGETANHSAAVSQSTRHPKRVFVVHGHDTQVKESTARFLERIGLEPIILHEQPSSGRTVIEKLEKYSDVGFAAVLLTPDDVGAPASAAAEIKPRARQNVILELGYFLGKLSRSRVCALYKSGVEIPSDYQGVIYVELDSAGAWKTRLAQELAEVGFSIKLDALLNS